MIPRIHTKADTVAQICNPIVPSVRWENAETGEFLEVHRSSGLEYATITKRPCPNKMEAEDLHPRCSRLIGIPGHAYLSIHKWTHAHTRVHTHTQTRQPMFKFCVHWLLTAVPIL